MQVGGLALEGAQVELETVSIGKKEVNPDGLGFQAVGAAIGGTPLAVTCYAVGDLARVSSEMAARYPSAAVAVVQPQRDAAAMPTACEAVVRGGPVKAAELAFTGTRIGFGPEAVERLKRDLTEAKADTGGLVAAHIYSMTASNKFSLPAGASSTIPVDGVASIDATFALDAVAPVGR